MAQLFIELAPQFCTFYSNESGNIKLIDTLEFSEFKDYQIKEQLNEFVKLKNINFSSFEEVTVSWVNLRASLLPMSIFKPEELETLFNATFSSIQEKFELDYTRISELSLVNIYEIPAWIKSFFVLKFPRVIIQHEYCHQLRGLMKNSFKLSIQVNIYKELASIQIADKNKLLFCNSFEIAHRNDLIYYLTFSLQKLELLEEGKINFHFNQTAKFTKEELEASLKKINSFGKLKMEFNTEKTIQHQSICV